MIGSVLLGKYTVESILGEGGAGLVVAAVHRDLRNRVAIKMLRPAVLSEIAIERFMREARASVKLESDHVVKILDFGRLDSGAPFMVMEHLQGRDLAAVAADGAVPSETAVDYVLQAIDALAEAHAYEIVHRDLKLSNLFLAQRADGAEIVKVLDFGIAKITEEVAAEITVTKIVLGSPHYMAPEQYRSARDVDARADIWALGAILYRLVSGKMPFKGGDDEQLFGAVLMMAPGPLRGQVDPGLEKVILRCLEKKPEDRFATVADLADALLPFGTGTFARCAERARKIRERGARGNSSEDSGVSGAEPLEAGEAGGLTVHRGEAVMPPSSRPLPPAPLSSRPAALNSPTSTAVERTALVATAQLPMAAIASPVLAPSFPMPSPSTTGQGRLAPPVMPPLPMPPPVVSDVRPMAPPPPRREPTPLWPFVVLAFGILAGMVLMLARGRRAPEKAVDPSPLMPTAAISTAPVVTASAPPSQPVPTVSETASVPPSSTPHVAPSPHRKPHPKDVKPAPSASAKPPSKSVLDYRD